jgi:DNA-binding NarL/FixJ family response regulator
MERVLRTGNRAVAPQIGRSIVDAGGISRKLEAGGVIYFGGGRVTTENAANLHVVVLDGDAAWRDSVRAALDRVGRPIVDAAEPDEAARLIDELEASLLVIGPGCAGRLEWLKAVRRDSHVLHIVVVVAEAAADAAAAAFAAGATAVISDTARTGSLASTLVLAAADSAKRDRFDLSDREVELLELVARGSSNAQIARTLWVSDQTVKFHLSRIYRKLGVSSRTEAVWVARSEGLVADQPARGA